MPSDGRLWIELSQLVFVADCPARVRKRGASMKSNVSFAVKNVFVGVDVVSSRASSWRLADVVWS
jgi:hypothetical protein